MEGDDLDDEYSDLERQLQQDLDEFDDDNDHNDDNDDNDDDDDGGAIIEIEREVISVDTTDDDWNHLLSQVTATSNDVLKTYELELQDCDVLLHEESPLKTSVVAAWTIDSRLSSISVIKSKESRDVLLHDIECNDNLCEDVFHVSKIIHTMDDLLRNALIQHDSADSDDVRCKIQEILDSIVKSVAFSATICVNREEKEKTIKFEPIPIIIPEEPEFSVVSPIQPDVVSNDSVLKLFGEQNLLYNQNKVVPSINFDVLDEETIRIKDLDRLKRQERKKKKEVILKQVLVEEQLKQEERIKHEAIAAEVKRLQEIEEERIKHEAVVAEIRVTRQIEGNLKLPKNIEPSKNMISLSKLAKPLTSWGGKFFQSSGLGAIAKSATADNAESSISSISDAIDAGDNVVKVNNEVLETWLESQSYRDNLLESEFGYPVVIHQPMCTNNMESVCSNAFQSLNVEKILVSALNNWKLWKKEVVFDPSTAKINKIVNNKSTLPAYWTAENMSFEVIETLDKLGISHNDTSLVESLIINVENVVNADFIQCFPNLKKLELNVNKLSNLHGLETLTLLTQLSVKDNVLTNIDALAGHEHIIDLELDNNYLSDAGVHLLSSIPNLINLSLKANQLTKIPTMNSSKLQKLELYNNSITLLEGSQFENTDCSLLYLDLGRNSIDHIDGNILSRCQCLRTLILSQNRLTSLPKNLYLPNLKVLWLSGNKISNFTAWLEDNNDPAIFLPLLEKLFLQDNAIQCIDNPCLLACPLLVELDISFNNFASLKAFNGKNTIK